MIGMAQYYYSDRQIRTEDLVDGAVTPAKLSFGTWEKIGEVDVTSSVSSVSFTGLDGDSDKFYLLCCRIINADSANQRGFQLRFNGDSGSNYSTEGFYVDGGSTSTKDISPDSQIEFCRVRAGDVGTALIFINPTTGKKREIVSYFSGDRFVGIYGGAWTNTTDNVTSISVLQIGGAYIGAGSKFILFRVST